MTDAAAPRAVWRLGFASAAVMLAAADTYVVVLALPNMLGDLGIDLAHLQQATPIISGFLLGYVVVLPLLGRLSDAYGRRPVFIACLAGFAVGSVMTASAHGLPMVVAGRTLQGLGGGGLVPVTLALVADTFAPERRGVPLGVVGAVQELGAVLGPLYGAVIVAGPGWRTIFWINLPLALVLGLGFGWGYGGRRAVDSGVASAPRRLVLRALDWPGALLLLVVAVAGLGALVAPDQLVESVAWGTLYTPLVGGGDVSGPLTWPITLICFGALVLFAVWETVAPRGVRLILPLRRLPEAVHVVDWIGGALIGGVLACIIIAFADADPGAQVISGGATVALPLAAILTGLVALWERRAHDPLIDARALSDRAAFGSLLVNVTVGAALMAVLVDIPIFARSTEFPGSQVGAALVLMRFLVAVPVGAVVGGLLSDRVPLRLVAAAGMALSAAMLLSFSAWSAGTLGEPGLLRTPIRVSDVELALCGLGFGLAIAPINAAILGAVKPALHGLASALVVVARMVGMLAGLSVLTAIGLRSFYATTATLPPATQLCPTTPTSCAAFDALQRGAIIDEMHAIFLGATICAALAALLAGLLLRRRRGAASRHGFAETVAGVALNETEGAPIMAG